MSRLNFQFEEIKDNDYAIDSLNKVFTYYKKNFDNIILLLPDFACFFLNAYCTDWFKFDGDEYSFTIVNNPEWKRIYVYTIKDVYDSKGNPIYKPKEDKVYRIGSIALVLEENVTTDNREDTIRITDKEFFNKLSKRIKLAEKEKFDLKDE